MKNAQEYLQEVTRLLPPGGGQRHRLELRKDGRLQIVLFMGEAVYPLTFREEELEDEPQVAAKKLQQAMHEPCIPLRANVGERR